MKKSVTWVVFAGISLWLTLFLIGMWFLFHPLGVMGDRGIGNKLRLESSLPIVVPTERHSKVVTSILKKVYEYPDGTFLAKIEVPLYTGLVDCWVLYSSEIAPLRVYPLISRRDSLLIDYLHRLETVPRKQGFTIEEIDGITGATIDKRLFEEKLKEGGEWIKTNYLSKRK